MNPVAPSAVVVGPQSVEAGSSGGESSVTGKPDKPGNERTTTRKRARIGERGAGADVGDPYDLGSPATATVTITDTDSPLVSVAAFDSTSSETGPDFGAFRFSRTGSTAAALTVAFTVTGSATNGTDYGKPAADGDLWRGTGDGGSLHCAVARWNSGRIGNRDRHRDRWCSLDLGSGSPATVTIAG